MDGHRVADFLVAGCAELGVRHIFGVDGANIEDVYDAVFARAAAGLEPAVTGVVAKHEFAAATMADGYARNSDAGIGVVAATSGGGAMNIVAGLAESYSSRIPVLALVGQPPTALEGNGAFQDSSGRAGSLDAERLFGAVSRYCTRVEHAQDVPWQFARAVTTAFADRGPAVLLLPKDVQQAAVDPDPAVRPHRPKSRRDPAGLAAVLDRLVHARTAGKVVIIAGDQVGRDQARGALRALARTLDATVGVTPDAKDAYPAREPGYGGVAGVMGHPELVDAIRESAACLLVGTRLSVTAQPASIAQAGTVLSLGAEEPYVAAVHADSTDLAADLDQLRTALARRLGDPPRRPRWVRTPGPAPLEPPSVAGPGLRYWEIVAAISATLPEGADVVADAGNTGAAVVHYLEVPRNGRFSVALGMGGMGYSFGAGIGSAFARASCPEYRRTVVVAGDGSFFMHGMEIHTAIEHRLPVTFVVLNNNAHAMCITREQLFYSDQYSFNRFRPARIGEGVAAMFPELRACTVRTRGELAEALRRSTEEDGPAFVAIDCDPDEIPPFVPFLASIASRSLT
ncbi:MAG: thiamine pyrophosphate-binding protein [Mycobacteriaceae bacterium]|nr:thiamine pyrophosphate-binding protein [Mycobacteriaceae bacterium]